MRRILSVLLSALLLFGGAAQAALCVRMDDAAALLDRDGREIVPPGTYADIVPLGDERFAAQGEDGAWALMDGDGALRTGFLYETLRIKDGLCMAQKDGRWGLLKDDGTPGSSFAYSCILPNGTGGAWAIVGDRNDGESDALSLISATGLVWATGVRVLDVGEGAEGLLPVQLPGSGLYGCMDASGNLTIPAEYAYIGDFINGVAPAVDGGKYGAIDIAGAWVVAPEYDFLQISPSGFLLATRDDGIYVFDSTGARLARYAGEDVYAALVGDGFYVVSNPDAIRLYDASNALLLEADPLASFTEGMNGQLILSDGAWGEECVHLLGTDAAYQNLYPLGTAGETPLYASLTVNVGRYVNDRLGEIQLSTDMDSARYGVVNGAGEQLLEPVYRALYFLEDDRLLARTDGDWRVIDSQGTVYWSCDAPMQTEATSF